ncbi:hypothetical protein FORC47_3021 [Bacillus cereus]|nr:hypothetical protein FORC47_3021 [Bacillus cereus]
MGNLHNLDSEILQLVVVREERGFRVSDVCQLQLKSYINNKKEYMSKKDSKKCI